MLTNLTEIETDLTLENLYHHIALMHATAVGCFYLNRIEAVARFTSTCIKKCLLTCNKILIFSRFISYILISFADILLCPSELSQWSLTDGDEGLVHAGIALLTHAPPSVDQPNAWWPSVQTSLARQVMSFIPIYVGS